MTRAVPVQRRVAGVPHIGKPLSHYQWLVWVCLISGMSIQQTAYSLDRTEQGVKDVRKVIAWKGWWKGF